MRVPRRCVMMQLGVFFVGTRDLALKHVAVVSAGLVWVVDSDAHLLRLSCLGREGYTGLLE